MNNTLNSSQPALFIATTFSTLLQHQSVVGSIHPSIFICSKIWFFRSTQTLLRTVSALLPPHLELTPFWHSRLFVITYIYIPSSCTKHSESSLLDTNKKSSCWWEIADRTCLFTVSNGSMEVCFWCLLVFTHNFHTINATLFWVHRVRVGVESCKTVFLGGETSYSFVPTLLL